MGFVKAVPAAKRTAAAIAVVVAALFAAPALGNAATAAPNTVSCPSFRVLHNDSIGPASFPAGSYTITVAPGPGLSCSAVSQLFSRFLQDWDGNLPAPWRVVAQGTGKATFNRGVQPGFSVARTGGGSGGNPSIGRLCPGSFTVNAGSRVGPLFFARGQYLLYLPAGTGIRCNRASVLFTRFLGQPNGILPFPWRLRNQTATFFKPENPVRSSFRVEPLAGS